MGNAAKNSYVRSRITQAEIALLEEKPLTDISISEITERAEVSRNSFYRNYGSKEDVLREYILRIVDEWGAAHGGEQERAEEEKLAEMFDHFVENREFYSLLHRRGELYLIRDILRAAIGPKGEQSNILAYTTAFIAGGLYSWIEEWFDRGMQENAAEMAALLKKRME